jgi:membrane-associated phospholipid phosphatase
MSKDALMATSFARANAYPESDVPLPRLRTICQLWSCAALLGGAGVAAIALDVPLARWVAAGHCPNVILKLCSLSEIFSHGLGVVLILIAIAVLDPWHRYAIPRIAAASLGSGLVANALKLFVARMRPHHFDLSGHGLESFGEWFPLLTNSSWEQSFPSSHTATAAGLAIVLACFYPRGRWLFPAMAGLAGAQRVLEHSHFLSDVFWGAAIGCIFAPLCVYGGRLSSWFDWLEEELLVRAGLLARAVRPRRPAKTASADAVRSDFRAA